MSSSSPEGGLSISVTVLLTPVTVAVVSTVAPLVVAAACRLLLRAVVSDNLVDKELKYAVALPLKLDGTEVVVLT